MINVDLQQLVQALDTETRRDLEGAAERCVARAGSKILVEDLLLGLLERPDSLLLRALQDAGVDTGELSGVLQPRGEASESRNPVFASELVQWLQDALLAASLDLGQSQIGCRADVDRVRTSAGKIEGDAVRPGGIRVGVGVENRLTQGSGAVVGRGGDEERGQKAAVFQHLAREAAGPSTT